MKQLNFENMDIAELILEIKNIEEKKFLLDMIDHWTSKDFEINDRYNLTIKKINEEINKRRKEDGK